MTQRPALTPALSGAEFERWYWLKEELAEFARSLGIRATGGKVLLTARIAATLDGREFSEPPSKRRTSGEQLSGVVTGESIVPAGQRCSQVVRAWFVEQVGPGFSFDEPMRAFFAATDGTQTLQDALDHWRSTRDRGETDIGSQFEYNRFTRAWHRDNPAGTPDEAREAWGSYRSRPVDQRGRA